jgi:hypothetical protein
MLEPLRHLRMLKRKVIELVNDVGRINDLVATE